MNVRIIASSRFLAILVVSIATIPKGLVIADYSCSVLCDCDIWYGLIRASCTGRRLYSIHTDTSNLVQALDLSDNTISSLGKCELAEAGLTNLRYLNLSKNSISDISLEAFSGITELAVLDLSRNYLYYLLSDIFLETKKLRILKLSGNNFNIHVPKLECPWLTKLDVDSCQISHIPPDTFTGLTHLQNLDLTNNLMIQLDNVVLKPLRSLNKISLEGNPWSCNGIMYDLVKDLRSRKIEYDTICNGTTKGTKKFEKMISIDTKVRANPTASSKGYANFNEVTRCHDDSNNTSKSSTQNDSQNVRKGSTKISPYWFLILGFLLGCATSMVVCYVCLLKRIIYCCRKNDYRESRTANDDPQRLFLLRNQWHVATEPTFDSSQTTISCPGTPPPPYRDVILRPGLYRAATPI